MLSYFAFPGPLEVALLIGIAMAALVFRYRRRVPEIERRRRIRFAGQAVGRVIFGVPPGCLLVCGGAAAFIGVLGFLASAATWGNDNIFASFFAGLLNPVFFLGVPVGLWLIRLSVRRSRRCQDAMRPKSETLAPASPQSNPRLSRCPDCFGPVSRLAAACPHCGRPLTPDGVDGMDK